MVARPVDGHARGVQLGQGLAGDGAVGVVGVEAVQPQVARLVVEALFAHAGEVARGAGLQEGVPPPVGDGAHAVGEADGSPQVAAPVGGGGQFGGVGDRAGEVGDDREPRLVEAEGGDHLGQGLGGLGHQRGVGGAGDGDAPGAYLPFRQRGLHLGEGVGGARKHQLAGTVDGCQGDVVVPLQQRADLGRRGLDRGHGPGRGGVHEPAAGRHQGGGVLQGEQAGDGAGGDLPDAVAREDGGPHPPGEPGHADRVLQGEQGGLHVVDAVDELGVVGVAEQHVPHRAAEVGPQEPVAVVQVPAELGELAVPGAAHADVLGAAAGEEERHLRGRGAAAARPGGPGEAAVQQPDDVVVGADRARQPQPEVGARGVGGVAQVAGAEVGPLAQQPLVPADLPAQRGRALGGEREDVRGVLGGRFRGGRRLGGLFEHHGRQSAGEAEGVDQGPAGPARPGAGRGRNGDGAGLPGDVAGGGGEVQVRVDGGVPHLEDGLDDAADAGGGLHVPDVRLQRADGDRVVPVARGTEDVADRADLDGVAERCAGAVGLDVGDVVRFEAGAGQGGAQESFLRRSVGHHEGTGLAVLADGRAPDEGVDAVPRGHRVGEPFEGEDRGALGAAVAVGGVVERLARAVGGQHLALAGQDVGARADDGVDAAAQREIGLARAQPLGREVQRDERGGAGGVDGDAGAAPPEEVRQPAGHGAERGAGGHVAVEFLGRVVGHLPRVVHVADGDVDPAAAVPQRAGVDTGVLQRLPGDLQDEPLLGVDVVGFPGRDVEELGVELVEVVEESALCAADGALRVGVVRVQRLGVPAVGGQGAHAGLPGAQELGEAVGRVVATWQAQADAHDGDGFLGGGHGGCLLLGPGDAGCPARAARPAAPKGPDRVRRPRARWFSGPAGPCRGRPGSRLRRICTRCRE